MQASHEEVLGKVSAILQNYDVGPSGKVIRIEDLDWFDFVLPPVPCFTVSYLFSIYMIYLTIF
jgi:hypothetical protein